MSSEGATYLWKDLHKEWLKPVSKSTKEAWPGVGTSDKQVLLLDIGSSTIKAAPGALSNVPSSSKDEPSCPLDQWLNATFFNINGPKEKERPFELRPPVELPSFVSSSVLPAKTTTYIGDQVLDNCGSEDMEITQVVERGVIKDYAKVETLLEHVFTNELGADSRQHGVVVSERVLNPIKNKEKLAQLLFETFEVPSVYFMEPCVLSLYAAGRSSGTVLSVGADVTTVSSIYNGAILPRTVHRENVGARDAACRQLDLLVGHGFFMKNSADVLRAYVTLQQSEGVALDFFSHVASEDFHGPKYELPNGDKFQVGQEACSNMEVFFSPHMINCESGGVAFMVSQSVQKAPMSLRSLLWSNIVLEGGAASAKGFQERLANDVYYNQFGHVHDVTKPNLAPLYDVQLAQYLRYLGEGLGVTDPFCEARSHFSRLCRREPSHQYTRGTDVDYILRRIEEYVGAGNPRKPNQQPYSVDMRIPLWCHVDKVRRCSAGLLGTNVCPLNAGYFDAIKPFPPDKARLPDEGTSDSSSKSREGLCYPSEYTRYKAMFGAYVLSHRAELHNNMYTYEQNEECRFRARSIYDPLLPGHRDTHK